MDEIKRFETDCPERVVVWGHTFIKAYQLRSGVLPQQVRLAIQPDHRFGSKWILN